MAYWAFVELGVVVAGKAGREPRYVQVAEELRARNVSGSLADGAQLPTESALCTHYGISRFTAREALRRLQTEGLIRRRQGSGTIVSTAPQQLRQSLSDIADLLQYAAGSEFSFEQKGEITLSAERAKELGIAEAGPWISLWGTRRLSDAHTLAFTEVFIQPALAAHVAGLKAGRQTLFAQLAEAGGFRVARIMQSINAIAAGPVEAAALGIPRRAPILRITRLYHDENDQIVEISVSYHPGDSFTYTMRIDED